MAGELENIFLRMGEGESVLVEGGIESGKEFFCRLLLREALYASLPVAVLSFHPEAHMAWFGEFAGKRAGLVRHAVVPQSLIESGIALKEHSMGCRFAYADFFEIFSAKFEADAILGSFNFNMGALKAARVSLLLSANPESVGQKDMARLRELFDIVIEVRRSGDKLEFRYKRHPRELGADWHGILLSEVTVSRGTLAEFCRTAMEYELKNVGHYGRNFPKFRGDDRDQLLNLCNASIAHFRELASLLEREGVEKSGPEEIESLLREALLEERVMKEKYAEYASETGNAASETFWRLAGEEALHEEIVGKMLKKGK